MPLSLLQIYCVCIFQPCSKFQELDQPPELDVSKAVMQILKPDIRVYGLVEELASGPLPSWDPLPTVLILNKVCLSQALTALCMYPRWL